MIKKSKINFVFNIENAFFLYSPITPKTKNVNGIIPAPLYIELHIINEREAEITNSVAPLFPPILPPNKPNTPENKPRGINKRFLPNPLNACISNELKFKSLKIGYTS